MCRELGFASCVSGFSVAGGWQIHDFARNMQRAAQDNVGKPYTRNFRSEGESRMPDLKLQDITRPKPQAMDPTAA